MDHDKTAGGTRQGLFIVYTGNGKGKTSAALGIVLRMLGRDMRVSMLQFIKKRGLRAGENRFGERVGVEIVGLGDGFTWTSANIEHDRRLAREGWHTCADRINSGTYDAVILDEITYCLNYGWLDLDEILATIHNRPAGLHVVVTGRDACPALIEAADLVTEMREVKHPFRQGVTAQPGIDL